jgi:hypothetical protein
MLADNHMLTYKVSSENFRRTVRLRAFALHFVVSALLAAIIAFLVFFIWFPANHNELAGGHHLFWTIVGVDVICGPLLTLLLFKPEKTRLALATDLTLIAVIQIAAFSYGLYSLAYARPLAFVFEVDRFRLVTYADIPATDIGYLPDWAKPWRLHSPRTLGLRPPATPSERLNSFNDALQGLEISQRPQRWQELSLNAREIRERSQTLPNLLSHRGAQKDVINGAVADAMANREKDESMDSSTLIWFPLVSRSSLEWIVILDPSTLRIRAYAKVDGFI